MTIWERVAHQLELVDWTADRVTPVTTGADAPDGLTARWSGIVTADGPADRRALAFAGWNAAFVALVPTFWSALHSAVVDVVPIRLDGEPVLAYAGERPDGTTAVWLGRDPGTNVRPAWWEGVPDGLRAFLADVHGGFTAVDGTCGPLPPAAMQTLSDLAGMPGENVPGWTYDGADDADTRRLLRIATDGYVDLCVSPDLPAGHAALAYEGDVETVPFATALDEMMTAYVDAG